MPLEPLPETRAALERLGELSDRDLLAELNAQATVVTALVPSCVGVSLSLFSDGVTFTLVATSDEIAALDGVQYVAGGPCVDAVEEDTVIWGGDRAGGLLDEDRWAAFARAGAAHGVLSTLSMPIHAGDRVVGGVNIYAAEPDAMRGKHTALAAVFGAWAPGATENADLSFATRDRARTTPHVIEEHETLDRAVGVVIAIQRVDPDTARELIAQAARRSRVDEVQVARALLAVHTGEDAR